MRNFLIWLVNTTQHMHDEITLITRNAGANFNDKALHFITFIGITAVVMMLSQVLFRILAKQRVTTISIIYTSSVVTGLAFGIELMQGVTGTGRMELADAIYGVLGMASYLFVYVIFALIFRAVKRSRKNSAAKQRYERQRQVV